MAWSVFDLPLGIRRTIAAGVALAVVGAAGFLVGRFSARPSVTPTVPHVVQATPLLLGDSARLPTDLLYAEAARPPAAALSAAFVVTPPLPPRSAPLNMPAVTVPAEGNFVRIPALDLEVPLVRAANLEESAILAALQKGVVRYPTGVEPGLPGRVVISGHSTGEPWKGTYRFAFLRAGKLRAGDVIHLDEGETRYTYRVTGQRVVNPRELPTLESAATRPLLSIVTCWPLWTTARRLVVDAELQATAPLRIVPPPPTV